MEHDMYKAVGTPYIFGKIFNCVNFTHKYSNK